MRGLALRSEHAGDGEATAITAAPAAHTPLAPNKCVVTTTGSEHAAASARAS